MTLTDEHLICERQHGTGFGGVQRIYRFPSGYGLSLVNSPILHSYSFAWEAAVLRDVTETGNFKDLAFDTPLTSSVEVFATDEEANAFIRRAAEEIGHIKAGI